MARALRAFGICLATLIWLALAGAALAQQGASAGPDYDAWRLFAEDVATRLSDDGASIDELEDLRLEVAERRAAFLAAQETNAGRISTVEAQVDALGPPPEEGASEDSEIALRRDMLNTQLAELRRPVISAEEAYTEADGLITAIDQSVRERYARQLFSRQPTPLNPVFWLPALSVLTDTGRQIWIEITTQLSLPMGSRVALDTLPLSLTIGFVGLMLLVRSRWWLRLFAGWAVSHTARGQGVIDFFLSLGQIVGPLLGMTLISWALDVSGLFGQIGQELIFAMPVLILPILLAKWLCLRLLPGGHGQSGPLQLDGPTQDRLRRLGALSGYVLSATFLLTTIESVGNYADVAFSVLHFPLRIISALILWRAGRILMEIGRTREADTGETRLGGSFLRMLGRLSIAAAFLGALLASAGYVVATEALLVPAILTLGLSGLLLVLQKLVYDIYALVTGTPEGEADGLVPVLIGFALALAALPLYALIWGARVADLTEIWSRFRAGFAVGETRISPTDFLTFAAIFVLGYALTRFVQSTLRTSVLPKTRMDVGGRNAIVSGVGYVGIFLAIIVAITSAGIDLSSIALVAGALSVGIGFGLQNVVSNFVSGIILLIERPISEGDWIEVGGQMGYVRDISVRSTRIETFDRTDVIIPNADLVSGTVTNWTRGNLVGRVIAPVGVAYGTDTKRVEEILKEVAENHALVVLNPPPAVLFVGFGDSALNFEIRAILRDVNWKLNVLSDLNHDIAKRFAKEGIEIPFPQRDIWMRAAPAAPPPSTSEASPMAHAAPIRNDDSDGGCE